MAEIKITFRDLNEGSTLIKVVAFDGQLDETNVDAEAKKIYQVISEMDNPSILLDFSELEYMNSKAIGYVTDWYSQVMGKEGKILIYNPRPNILDILKVVGITQIIDIYSDMETAKGILTGQPVTPAASAPVAPVAEPAMAAQTAPQAVAPTQVAPEAPIQTAPLATGPIEPPATQ